jgi:hypothetical protein
MDKVKIPPFMLNGNKSIIYSQIVLLYLLIFFFKYVYISENLVLKMNILFHSKYIKRRKSWYNAVIHKWWWQWRDKCWRWSRGTKAEYRSQIYIKHKLIIVKYGLNIKWTDSNTVYTELLKLLTYFTNYVFH